jgi:hypothetical protein
LHKLPLSADRRQRRGLGKVRDVPSTGSDGVNTEAPDNSFKPSWQRTYHSVPTLGGIESDRQRAGRKKPDGKKPDRQDAENDTEEQKDLSSQTRRDVDLSARSTNESQCHQKSGQECSLGRLKSSPLVPLTLLGVQQTVELLILSDRWSA